MLLLLGAALASRNLAGKAAERGAGALSSSPEVSRLVEQGREAMVAALSNRIELLTDQLHNRTEALRQPGGPDGERPEEPEQPEAAEAEEEEEEEEYEGEETPEEAEYEGEETPEEESEPEPAPHGRARPRGSSPRKRAAQPRGRANRAGRRAPASQSRR
jgi:hypothetical protein